MALAARVVAKAARAGVERRDEHEVGGEVACPQPRVWVAPTKRLVHVGAYVAEPEHWVLRMQEAGLPASQGRDEQAVQTAITPKTFYPHGMLLGEFIADAFAAPDAGLR